MEVPAVFCRAMAAAVVLVSNFPPVLAEPPPEMTSQTFPKMLNEPVMHSDQSVTVPFQLAQTWEQLPKGTRLVGKYDAKLNVCITMVRLPDRTPEYAKPGRCLARAIPAPDAVVQRQASGNLVVPHAQPFMITAFDDEWAAGHALAVQPGR